jgi:hypothetical protein
MSRPETAGRRLVSGLIATILALQVIAGFKLLCPPRSLPALAALRIVCSPRLWPFLDYNMYIAAHHEGETIEELELVAERSDGTIAPVHAAMLDLDPRDFRREFLAPMRRREAAFEDLAGRLAPVLGFSPARLLLQRETYRVVADGPSRGAPRTIRILAPQEAP